MSRVLSKALRDLRWQVVWYGLGLASMAALVVYIYPSYREQLADFEIPEALQALLGETDYRTPVGFLTGEFYSWTPLLLAVFAIMAGTSALAGEEASGTLELLLSQPISRARLALSKMAGVAISALLIVALTCLGWLLSVPFVDIDISLGRLFVATLLQTPFILLLAALSMWLAAALPDRRQATGLVTAFAVLSFFINYLAQLVDVLSPLRWASFFFYQDSPNVLAHGPEPWKLGVMLAATLVFAVLTLVTFERREIGVHGSLRLLSRLRLHKRGGGEAERPGRLGPGELQPRA